MKKGDSSGQYVGGGGNLFPQIARRVMRGENSEEYVGGDKSQEKKKHTVKVEFIY